MPWPMIREFQAGNLLLWIVGVVGVVAPKEPARVGSGLINCQALGDRRG